jgi:lipooligosaccharide transport system permease protein
MMMLSGVFFPVDQLPHAVQVIAMALPLYHGVEIVRPLLLGALPTHVLLHVAVLAAYAAAGFYIATVLTRRRLLT